MKPLALIGVFAALALTVPASAQNAGQIAQARRGASCPKCNLFQADMAGLEMRGQNFAPSDRSHSSAPAAFSVSVFRSAGLLRLWPPFIVSA